jgi:hypothetical protein
LATYKKVNVQTFFTVHFITSNIRWLQFVYISIRNLMQTGSEVKLKYRSGPGPEPGLAHSSLIGMQRWQSCIDIPVFGLGRLPIWAGNHYTGTQCGTLTDWLVFVTDASLDCRKESVPKLYIRGASATVLALSYILRLFGFRSRRSRPPNFSDLFPFLHCDKFWSFETASTVRLSSSNLLYPTAYSFYSEISISIYLFIMRIKVESY